MLRSQIISIFFIFSLANSLFSAIPSEFSIRLHKRYSKFYGSPFSYYLLYPNEYSRKNKYKMIFVNLNREVFEENAEENLYDILQEVNLKSYILIFPYEDGSFDPAIWNKDKTKKFCYGLENSERIEGTEWICLGFCSGANYALSFYSYNQNRFSKLILINPEFNEDIDFEMIETGKTIFIDNATLGYCQFDRDELNILSNNTTDSPDSLTITVSASKINELIINAISE